MSRINWRVQCILFFLNHYQTENNCKLSNSQVIKSQFLSKQWYVHYQKFSRIKDGLKYLLNSHINSEFVGITRDKINPIIIATLNDNIVFHFKCMRMITPIFTLSSSVRHTTVTPVGISTNDVAKFSWFLFPNSLQD